MGLFNHMIFGTGKVVPSVLRLHVDLAKFPLSKRIGLATLKPSRLLVFGHRKVKLDKDHPLLGQIAFKPFDAVHKIVVLFLGAKTKDNVMSNALRARVDYAIELYQSGQVGAVIFTGGFRDKDPAREQSESALARDYAVQRGVPTQRIWIEQRSTTTLENLREAQAIVNAQGFAQVALVSDRWHLARAQAMARDLDLPVVPAPTPYSVYRSPWPQAKFIGRELWTRWAYAVLGI